MGWAEARDRIVAIVEGSTVATRQRQIPAAFHYAETAPTTPPDSRGFYFLKPTRVSMHGQTTPILPNRTRVTTALVFAYALDMEWAAAVDIILSDFNVLAKRLNDSALWAGETSTIENLSASENELSEASIADVDGQTRLTFDLVIEYRTT